MKLGKIKCSEDILHYDSEGIESLIKQFNLTLIDTTPDADTVTYTLTLSGNIFRELDENEPIPYYEVALNHSQADGFSWKLTEEK